MVMVRTPMFAIAPLKIHVSCTLKTALFQISFFVVYVLIFIAYGLVVKLIWCPTRHFSVQTLVRRQEGLVAFDG